MNLKKKLQNPFVLIAQGFVAGSIIFYATMPAETQSQAAAAPAQSVESPEKVFA